MQAQGICHGRKEARKSGGRFSKKRSDFDCLDSDVKRVIIIHVGGLLQLSSLRERKETTTTKNSERTSNTAVVDDKKQKEHG